MRHALLLACLSTALLCAADPAPAPAVRPTIGVVLAPPVEGETAKGLLVTTVMAGTTAEKLGLAVGDRITSASGKAIASTDDFAAATSAWTVGAKAEVTVQRAGASLVLSTTVVEPPRPRELGLQAQALQRQVAELRNDGPSKRLEELLTLLQQVEKDLPAMAAEFKRHYPKGRFSISMHIDITSDASDPAPAAVQPAPVRGATAAATP